MGQVMPRDADTQISVIPNKTNSLKIVYNADTDTNDKISVEDDIVEYQGDLPGLKNGTTVSNPRSAVAGRFDSHELTSGTLSVSGWYTIAEIESGGLRSGISDFTIYGNGGSRVGGIKARAGHDTSSNTKTFENNIIEILGRSFATSTSPIEAIRIAKSDSVSTAGAKLQVYCNISTTINIYVSMGQNTSIASQVGWELVTPTLTDNDKVPDGSTATFLEAGAELVIPQFGAIPGHVKKNADTQMLFTIPWAQIPKQGAPISFDFASSGILLRDGQGTGVTLPETDFTISSPTIIGELVQFIYTATVGTPFATLNSGPCFALVTGADMTITIG